MVALDVVDPRLFDHQQIRPAYQNIVNLMTGEVVGAEALARWPELNVSPTEAFEAARRADRSEQLDHLCQRAAIEGVRGVRLPPDFALFVNIEPDSGPGPCVTLPCSAKVVAEVTERALLHQPSRLLRSLRAIKERGCGIALDDVGSVPETIALLPFVMPDVIKLDVSLVHAQPGIDQARIVTAVAAYAERTGATILAEGIETQKDFDQALTLGASLGQGWFFSQPGPLFSHPKIRQPLRLLAQSEVGGGTPFGLLDPRRLRVGSKRQLLAISRHLEHQAGNLGSPPMVISALQDYANFTPATAQRYGELATRCPLVVALGHGMPRQPVQRVRGADVSLNDPLAGEWTVVVVGAHYMGALIARDLGDSGPDLDRRFQFVLTHDHRTVVQASQALLGRLDPVRLDTVHVLA